MSYTKFCDPWTASDPISAEAMNHIEGQWTAIDAEITAHTHDTRYYTKTASDAKFFTTTFYSTFDADTIDGSHLADLISDIMPIGAIMMWHGLDSAVPAGWYVCDGTAHGGYTTPNMVERFVIGAGGSYDPGDTGGPGSWNGTITPAGTVTVGDHVLTTAELPSHTHSYDDYRGDWYDTSTYLPESVCKSMSSTSQTINEQATGGGAHNHTTSSSITFNAIDPRPAYYAAYFIMKCE